MKDGLRSTGGQFGGGFHIAEAAGLLREGPGLLRRHWSSALSGEAGPGLLVSPEVSLAAHQDHRGGRGEAPQLRQPQTDCTEERGDVTDLEAQQEHVSLAVSHLAGIVGAGRAWNITETLVRLLTT